MTVFKKVAAATVGIGMLMPSFALAQTPTTTASTIQALLNQIKALQEQILNLQKQQVEAYASLATQLKQGDKGENVKILQQLLAQDPTIYPEGMITGFFGRLTAEAVKRFQKKHGFEQVGNVGPKTLKRINEIFGKIGNPGKGHDEDNDGEDDVASTTPGVGKVTICHKGKHTIYVGAPAWNAHQKHGDTLGSCGGTPQPTTTPDTVAPVISNLGANGITFNGATINWTTNENATGQVEYGTTTSYGLMSPLFASLTTSHSIPLTGLATSTLYNFRVISKDAAGNTATSSNMTFTTGTPDTSAPVLSGILVSPVGSTTATISWASSENATGKVYYGTSTPLNTGTALTLSNVSLQGTHVFNLSGLSASTTYYYILESKDGANNTATSSEGNFTTTN